MDRRLRDMGLGAALVALALAAPACGARAGSEPAPVITQQETRVGDRVLHYTAEAGRVVIKDVQNGEPVGYLFYEAFRMPAPKGTVRPITFIWNGGPGVATVILNYEGGGPKRVENGKIVDNADTWLTDSDLVFLDAMGTGFSRATSPETEKYFISEVGDVAATTEFVRSWILLHGAEDAPIVIAGESYGAGRASAVTYQLVKRHMHVRGVVLISNTSGLPTYPDRDIIANAIHIGDYGVEALYYHRIPADIGTTPDQVRASNEKWAREVYMPALRNIDKLSDAQKAKVVAELARRIGLKPADINAKTMTITQGSFLGHAGAGKRLYYEDYRIALPYTQPDMSAAVHYLRHELNYPSDLPYLDVESLQDGFAPTGTYPKTVNENWFHTTVYGATPEQVHEAEAAFEKRGVIGMGKFGPDLPGAGKAIELDPTLKVLVAHGAYDALGGCSMDAELGRQLPSPYKEDVTYRCYVGGHVLYRDAPARAQFAADMRAFMRQAAEPPAAPPKASAK